MSFSVSCWQTVCEIQLNDLIYLTDISNILYHLHYSGIKIIWENEFCTLLLWIWTNNGNAKMMNVPQFFLHTLICRKLQKHKRNAQRISLKENWAGDSNSSKMFRYLEIVCIFVIFFPTSTAHALQNVGLCVSGRNHVYVTFVSFLILKC